MVVLIKGAGDIATGVAHRLRMAGFLVIMSELENPLAVRLCASFANAVYLGKATIDGITAVAAKDAAHIVRILEKGNIPVVTKSSLNIVRLTNPTVMVDAIMAKVNTGTSITSASLVIALGPGFTAGADCHAVVETNRGLNLGKAFYKGTAEVDTGVPSEVGGYSKKRLLRAPQDGVFTAKAEISSTVKKGDIVGFVDMTPVTASIGGVVRGMLHSGLLVQKGMKVGDIDPSCEPQSCYSISDKARAVGGGVLEAILHLKMSTDRAFSGATNEMNFIS